MAKRKVVNTDNLSGTTDGAKLLHVIVYDSKGSQQVDAENGTFVSVGGLVDGEEEALKATVIADGDSTAKMVALVASEEIPYDERLTIEDFYNKAGTIARAYLLQAGDRFSIKNGKDATIGTPITVGTVTLNPVKKKADGFITYLVQ